MCAEGNMPPRGYPGLGEIVGSTRPDPAEDRFWRERREWEERDIAYQQYAMMATNAAAGAVRAPPAAPCRPSPFADGVYFHTTSRMLEALAEADPDCAFTPEQAWDFLYDLLPEKTRFELESV